MNRYLLRRQRKMRRNRKVKRDLRIAREAYETSNDKVFELAVRARDFLWLDLADIPAADHRYQKLTPYLRGLTLVVLLERELSAGGFLRYFQGPYCFFSGYTVEGLDMIEAKEHAKLLKRAMKIFPDSRVPRDRDRRWRALLLEDNDRFQRMLEWDGNPAGDHEAMCHPLILARLRKCDYRWSALNKQKSSLQQRIEKFVGAHIDEFVR